MQNVGKSDVYLENAMSLSLDIGRDGLDLLSSTEATSMSDSSSALLS